MTADLARPEDCAAVVTAAVRAVGRLDVLFNNAGVGTMVVGGTVETIELDRWDLALDVNVRGIYLVSRAAVPLMRRTGGGSIINTASVSAFRGSASRPSHAYAASKGAVLALTHAMAASYGRDRIRVNAICPGTIRTRLTADIIERVERDVAEAARSRSGASASRRTSRAVPSSSPRTTRRGSAAPRSWSTAARSPPRPERAQPTNTPPDGCNSSPVK